MESSCWLNRDVLLTQVNFDIELLWTYSGNASLIKALSKHKTGNLIWNQSELGLRKHSGNIHDIVLFFYNILIFLSLPARLLQCLLICLLMVFSRFVMVALNVMFSTISLIPIIFNDTQNLNFALTKFCFYICKFYILYLGRFPTFSFICHV